MILPHLQHHTGREFLADAVGLHDGLDLALRHVLVVRQQLRGALWQAAAAATETRIR